MSRFCRLYRHAIVVFGTVIVVVLLTQTTGFGSGVCHHWCLRVLGHTVHGAAAVAHIAIPGHGQDAVAGALSHVHDILAECILLPPVLHTFLSLVITLTAVDDEQGAECTKYASKNTYGYNNVHPCPELIGSFWCLATDSRAEAVVGRAFFIGVATCAESLGLNANLLLRVAIHAIYAVTAGHNVDKFVATRITNVRRILYHALKTKCHICVHADIVETDRAIEVETMGCIISQLGKIGRRLALIITIKLTRTANGQ